MEVGATFPLALQPNIAQSTDCGNAVHQARLFFNKYARSISGASRILNAEMAVTPGGVTWRIAEVNIPGGMIWAD